MITKRKHGGNRLGAGRPHKWHGGATKLVRIPISYVAQILRVVEYMDCNEGRLPTHIAFHTEGEDFVLPGYDASAELPYPDSNRFYKRRQSSIFGENFHK
ncbi:hypothetical protein IQ269_26480 [Tychonema sp. LEGE 07199]|uniref:hypothetical protein n=1 Tax=unclassified Tychonema TaxID=2642144 RepID=UPI00187F205C|nr:MULTISPECIES: hypothetical protein [unclassified Tychonema]MBE9124248.1 hypothetical protein [Tychonema sp. LEGE 07199]MBE9135411.1 hypothetical protein [Tychonema sp. LEGE 07196]